MSEKRFRFPLDIQNFADGDGDGGGTGAQATLPSTSQSTPQATTINYDKIPDIIGKRSSSTEDMVLKGYFKQQGLTLKKQHKRWNSTSKHERLKKRNKKQHKKS